MKVIEVSKFVYVSVAQSFREFMSLSQLEEFAAYRWGIGQTAAKECERLIAVWSSEPIAAWPIRGAYPDAVATYSKGRSDKRPRAVFDLGDPLPVLPLYREFVPASEALAGGAVIVDVPDERVTDLHRIRTYPNGMPANFDLI